jgi:hypothetical protein
MTDDTKYGHLIHDGAFEPDDDTDQPDPSPRVTVAQHTLVLRETVDEEYISHYEWRFTIEHDDGERAVCGWSKLDVEHNGTEDYCNSGTWQSMPADVKLRLAQALGVRRSELDEMLDLPDFLLGGDGDE